MEVGTKLKACVVLSLIALILKIVAIASPGWTVVKTDIYVNPMDNLMPEDDGLRVDDTELMKPHKERVTVSFGLWYYKVCKHGGDDDDDDSGSKEDSSEENFDGDTPSPKESDDDRHHKRHHRHHRHHRRHRCYHRCYSKKEHKQMIDHVGEEDDENKDDMEIPTEFRQAEDFIRGSVEVARHARHELAWYATIGLGLGVVGMVGAIVYARYGGLGKHSGRLACSTQILSAFFYFMAIIRVASYMVQLDAGKNLLTDPVTMDIDFECPWCLWVAAVGASLMGLVALFHMLMISRDRTSQRSEYVFHSEKNKIPIIAPKGYEQLIVPPMYEEAGPLPEKIPVS